MFGKSLSDNHKNILSSSFKEKGNPFYGKVHTEESKEKMKKSWECRSLKTSPNKGKKMSQEQKDKISKTLKEKKKENLILLYRNYWLEIHISKSLKFKINKLKKINYANVI